MPEEHDTRKALFANLVMMLSTSSLQQLGKVPDPISGKTEVNLEGARMTIDMLEMLQARTQGNLDKDEAGMLRDVLAGLQMNYVETARGRSGSSGTPPASGGAGDEQEPAAPAQDRGDTVRPSGDTRREPRYHKSYGA